MAIRPIRSINYLAKAVVDHTDGAQLDTHAVHVDGRLVALGEGAIFYNRLPNLLAVAQRRHWHAFEDHRPLDLEAVCVAVIAR